MVTLSQVSVPLETPVADWSQAKIGYTERLFSTLGWIVADWSQAKIGYTDGCYRSTYIEVADWSQAKIGYTGPA